MQRASDDEKKKYKYFVDDYYSKFENLFYTTKGVLLEHLRHQTKSPERRRSPNRATKNAECKLPVLDAPTFSGNLLDWPTFSDLFKAIIDNNIDLSRAQKLQYLKASLKGDAINVLQATKITDENYTTAWKTLEDRYDVKNALVNAQCLDDTAKSN